MDEGQDPFQVVRLAEETREQTLEALHDGLGTRARARWVQRPNRAPI